MKLLLATIFVASSFVGFAADEEPANIRLETWVLGFDRPAGPVTVVGNAAATPEQVGGNGPSSAGTMGSSLTLSGIGLTFLNTPEGIRWNAATTSDAKTFDELQEADLRSYALVLKRQLSVTMAENQQADMRINQEAGQYFEPASDKDETLFRLVNISESPGAVTSPGMTFRVRAERIGEETCQLQTHLTLTELVERENMDGVALHVGKPSVRKTELPDTDAYYHPYTLRYEDLLATYVETAPSNSYLLLTRVQKAANEPPAPATPSSTKQASFSFPCYLIKGGKDDARSFRHAFLHAILPASDIPVNQPDTLPFRTLKWDALARWMPGNTSTAPPDSEARTGLKQLLDANSSSCELLMCHRMTIGVKPAAGSGDYIYVTSASPNQVPVAKLEEKNEQSASTYVFDWSEYSDVFDWLLKGINRAKSDTLGPSIIADFSTRMYERDGLMQPVNVGIACGILAKWPESGDILPIRFSFRRNTFTKSALGGTGFLAGIKRHLFGEIKGELTDEQNFDSTFSLPDGEIVCFVGDALDTDATVLVIVTMKIIDPNRQGSAEAEGLGW